jgi:putative hydrolase of the HAD superfamily
MIKTVFFDLYFTLVRYEPTQEELEAQALKEFGIDADPRIFQRPLAMANEYIYNEIARCPLGQRPKEEIKALYTQFQRIALKEAGIKADENVILALPAKIQQYSMKLVLFNDVAPALTDLKNRGLVLGLISNVDRDITATINELGLSSWLNIVVTSLDAGFSKPQPGIFQEAMRRAKVQPSEAMYVGDQYQIDCIGARNAALKGILLDRGGYFGDITDFPRIRSLTELAGHLE